MNATTKLIVPILIITSIIINTTVVTAQESDRRIWSTGSAYVLPQKRVEVGLFQPLRYGFRNNMEWSAHPLLFFIMPNVSLKWIHQSKRNQAVATRHSVFYPTFLLRTVSREGTGGFISPEFTIPHLFAVINEVLISKTIGERALMTGKAGLALAAKFGSLDARTTIDLPLVYNRMDVFYHGYQLRSGVEFQGRLSQRWNVLIDGDFYYIPGVDHNKAFEQKSMLIWNKSHKTQISIGYKLVYGEYPFGSQWHLLIPLDIQKAWSRK